MTYCPAPRGTGYFNTFGYGSAGYDEGTITNNYLIGGQCAMEVKNPGTNTITGNTFVGDVIGFEPKEYPQNTYIPRGSAPTGHVVFVRPNAYETGGGNVIVYNWDLLDTVAVDLSPVLAVGSTYQIRNAADFFGAPVASGTYGGGAVPLPMSGLSTAAPVGDVAPSPTGPEFNIFVVRTTSWARMSPQDLERPRGVPQVSPRERRLSQ
jgi:hypothetical protein